MLPISPAHEALAKIGRDFHPHRINRVINHPAVYPSVCGYQTDRLDVGPAVADENNVLLMGEYGGTLFHMRQPGLYEVHTQVVPEGRGAWTLAMVRASLHWMFTRTTAVEILTRVPQGNLAALALVKRIGGKFWFQNPTGWIKDRDPIPADIYRLSLYDWMEKAPGLSERGDWFFSRLGEECARLEQPAPSWPTDPEYVRQIGLAVEMLLGGQAVKAQVFLNRFGVMAEWPQVSVVQLDPVVINTGYALLTFRDEDFYVSAFL